MRRLVSSALAAVVVWKLIDADWPSAVAFTVMFVFGVWREMPERMISVLAAIGFTAVAIDVRIWEMPWWGIAAVVLGAPILFGAILLVVASRLGERTPPPSPG